jgi:uncharacterized protein
MFHTNLTHVRDLTGSQKSPLLPEWFSNPSRSIAVFVKHLGNELAIPLLASAVIFGIVLCTPVAHATSFDCGKAAIRAEKQICANDELSRMDDALAHDYQFAVNSVSTEDLSKLRESQQKWLRARNACKTLRCISEQYEEQILSLRYLNCTEHTSTSEEICPSEPTHATMPGEHGAAQCAYAHMEVADRRRRIAEKDLIELWVHSKDTRDLRIILSKSDEHWIKARDKSCMARNLNYLRYESEGGTFDYTDAEMWGFCLRRLIEERADNMEYVIKEKQIQGKKSDRKHLLKYLNGRLLERPSLD